ncbi:flagellar protein FlhE [Enterobacter roggenkampii]|uniref:flagellar protein FlhE n=1 Tax=Enterobacter roggenkampii TaxID=1812935 RepID=UPI000C1F3B51|nr:flagellar protein FlhE [Enterobacter roggenkampii]MBW7749271.1 flagellar protein FlhE [Enterobacter roggenkampii]PJD15557.1 flagellar protein FlhE [Enterobacter roggenkampii]PJD23913.1 flagellar protein FlhE [Enterobacter roggenkampii]PJD25801.1 flagellar protein FlhE [Enterobacter roggenkampii]
MRKWLWMLFFPLVAQAAGGGTWQASSMGVTLSNRGVAMSSNPLVPAEEVSGLMGLVVWNYRLIGPTPAGLRVRLCSQTRCTEIDGENGTTQAFNGVPAIEPLRFIWEVPGGGRLIPALKVQSNSVIVNYR